jgi:predicted ATPase/class 3 adenylate cyclase
VALAVRLVGRAGLELDGVAVADGGLGRLGWVALAYLVTERGRPVDRHELAEVLWGEDLPATWGSALRTHVTKVRGLLRTAGLTDGALTSARGCYELSLPDDSVVDVEAAAADLAAGRAALAVSDFGAAQRHGTTAVAVLEHRFLPGAPGLWVEQQQDRGRRWHLEALEVLARASIATVAWESAADAAQAALDLEPFRESAHVLLMRAHAGAGRRADAFTAYERCRNALDEHLGVTPSAETEALRAALVDSSGAAPPPAAPSHPMGTVALLFTDIEASTQRSRELGEAYPVLLEQHNAVLRTAWRAAGGHEVGTAGDSFFVVFDTVERAVDAAVAAQRALARESWSGGTLRVRMGIHAGAVTTSGEDYVGLSIHVAARVAAAAHGGQVVVSEPARTLLPPDLGDIAMRDLGGHALKDVPEIRIWQVVAPGLEDGFPPLRSLRRDGTTGLPAYLNSFVGRDDDVAAVAGLLSDRRLVVITGPGGAGKTRLAVELLRTKPDAGTDGTWFVDLSDVADGQAAEAIASTTGVPEQSGRPLLDSVAEFLGDRRVLLALDNCEQLLDDAAGIAVNLLQRCPTLTLVCTSRERLGVPGEAVWPLGALPSEPSAGDRAGAVDLFLDRARDAGAAVDGVDRAVVAQLCAMVDGLPLAVELVASHAAAVPLAELCGDVAVAMVRDPGGRGRPERHRTMTAAVEWSYRLLSASEQRLFDEVSVFAGGFTARAVDVVSSSDSSRELLSALVRRSLLEAEPWPSSRFVLLETVRAFGRARLGQRADGDEVHRRHAQHYASVLRDAGRDLANASPDAMAEIDLEQANVRAALGWAVGSDQGLALTLGGRLFRYWSARGMYTEALDWCRRIIEATTVTRSTARVRLLNGAGHLATLSGRWLEARAWHELALELAEEVGSKDGVAWAQHYLGHTAEEVSDFRLAEDWGRSGLEGFEGIGDGQGVAYSWYWIGRAVLGRGALDEADDHFRRCTHAADALEDGHCAMVALHGLAATAMARDVGSAEAAERAAELTAVAGDRRDPYFEAAGRAMVAMSAAYRGDVTADELAAALAAAQRVNDGNAAALALTAASCAFEQRGRDDLAARLLGDADAVDRPNGLGAARALALGRAGMVSPVGRSRVPAEVTRAAASLLAERDPA